MFKNSFSFKGRIRRLEYGLSCIVYLLVFSIIDLIMESGDEIIFVAYLAYIPMFWFFWAQGAKRCHDRGNSGWYQIIPFYMLWMIFGDGEPGINPYGSNPKGI
jgi:uncharacterized membrane protein YhaH (DUF805 family)